ncbi:MAG: class I SAM-dependent methyltransferase [Ascidiaceihabitans sp.]|jgi:ubiquinone/menaquinone biosynthesis C-methylase UbiE|tara:strand:+ start:570 stop:1184 length:615 start_codon:yes stop_codon:yes gene_type:complete
MTNAAFWNKAAPKYAKDAIGDMPAYEETLDRMREILQPHHRVLELGCGTGSTALELADSVDRYIGTDVASKMVKIAKGKLTEQSPQNLSFAVQDAGVMTSGSNDVVLALNLLHLLPDLENTLAEIYKALPSGGLLISKTGLLKDGLWLLPLVIPLMRTIGKAPFVRSLSEESLIGLLENAGFKVTENLVQGGMVPRVFIVAQKL